MQKCLATFAAFSYSRPFFFGVSVGGAGEEKAHQSTLLQNIIFFKLSMRYERRCVPVFQLRKYFLC